MVGCGGVSSFFSHCLWRRFINEVMRWRRFCLLKTIEWR
jgi:hypothetical protein